MTAIRALLWREVRGELRGREIVPIVVVFGLLVLVIMNFAFEPSGEEAKLLAPGVLWVALAFSGILGVSRAASRDEENGALDGLLAAPIDRGTLYLGKMLSNLVFMFLADLVLVPVFLVLYDMASLKNLAGMLPVVLLGTIGFVAVGTIFAAVAVNTRMREMLLPIVFLPVAVPILLAAVEATSIILRGEETRYLFSWIRILLVADFIFLVLSYLLFEYVLED
ncbi:MAG TPA: heme exporter protein CcmB [Myxococcota bacterium]|nr:heme exporter protein CcmB [Myxococcota bacterium]